MIDDSKSIMKMAKLLQESIYEAGQNVTARADVKDKGSVRYSIKNTRSLSWREQLDRYFSGNLKSSDSLYLGKTPDYLQAVQVEPAPVYVPTSVITKGMRLKKKTAGPHMGCLSRFLKTYRIRCIIQLPLFITRLKPRWCL